MARVSLPDLDVLDPETQANAPEQVGRYRTFYFVRRSIATANEFSDALRRLDENKQFRSAFSLFDEWSRKEWVEAMAFFDKKRARLIQDIRNDIGGHFGEEAAKNALTRLKQDAIGKIELIDGRDIRLHFAGEIAATALSRHLRNEDVQNYLELLKGTIVEAYRYAITCVHILVKVELWNRFGR